MIINNIVGNNVKQQLAIYGRGVGIHSLDNTRNCSSKTYDKKNTSHCYRLFSNKQYCLSVDVQTDVNMYSTNAQATHKGCYANICRHTEAFHRAAGMGNYCTRLVPRLSRVVSDLGR